MRAFAAIELPDVVKEPVAELIGRLRGHGAQASWVRAENMHLTLRFYGEITEAQAGRAGDVMAAMCGRVGMFSLRVRMTGAFPHVRKPSVLWVGVEPFEGGLATVHEAAEAAAREIGVAPDEKAFHPHVTLARIRDGRTVGALMEAFAAEHDFDAGAFDVGSVTLFSSDLTARGPVYRAVREIEFC